MRRLFVVLLLFVSCSGCAWWVVKTSPPTGDNGWLSLCWEPENDAPNAPILGHFYAAECEIAPMVEFTGWSRLPIRLALSVDAEPYRTDIVTAIANWNRLVGFELFRITKLGWDVTVIADNTKPFELLRGGVHFAREAGVLTAAMYLYLNAAPPGASGTIETIEHELGHILGLEHDENRNSLMYGTYEGQHRRLTVHDWSLVKQRYSKMLR